MRTSAQHGSAWTPQGWSGSRWAQHHANLSVLWLHPKGCGQQCGRAHYDQSSAKWCSLAQSSLCLHCPQFGDAVLISGSRGVGEMPSCTVMRWETAGRRGFFLLGATLRIRLHLFVCGTKRDKASERVGEQTLCRSESVAEPISWHNCLEITHPLKLNSDFICKTLWYFWW